MKLLVTAKIIERPASPEHTQWIAGKAVLVFTGDLIDKGPHSLKVVQLAAALRKAAAESGGQVVTLLGNHEAEFLADPSEKKVKDFAQNLRGAGLTPEMSRRAEAKWDSSCARFLLPLAWTIGSFRMAAILAGGPSRSSRPISKTASARMASAAGSSVDANSMLEARLSGVLPAEILV